MYGNMLDVILDSLKRWFYDDVWNVELYIDFKLK